MVERETERTARRILSLWLPRLPTDAHSRRHPERRDHPLAAILAERGRLGVAAVNRAAAEAGVRLGMSLADARAIEPALAVFDAEPESDARLLERIAGWGTRSTPWTTPDGPDGVALDITGCAHLFGGEEAMAADLTARLTAAGFESRLAVADTPAAAWALARFGRKAPTLPLRGSLPSPLSQGRDREPPPLRQRGRVGVGAMSLSSPSGPRP